MVDPSGARGGEPPAKQGEVRSGGTATSQLRRSRSAAPPANLDARLSEMVVDEQTNAAISAVLRRLLQASHAGCAMVLDRAGQIIVYEGTEYSDEMMMLGALVAGTYASTREMARILHEDNFRMLLQEGAKEKIFTEAIGDHWLISIIFDRHTHLGLVKVLCDRATTELADILRVTVETNRNRPRLQDSGLARITRDTIDLIFRDDSGR